MVGELKPGDDDWQVEALVIDFYASRNCIPEKNKDYAYFMI